MEDEIPSVNYINSVEMLSDMWHYTTVLGDIIKIHKISARFKAVSF